jgi:hypothetical protein
VHVSMPYACKAVVAVGAATTAVWTSQSRRQSTGLLIQDVCWPHLHLHVGQLNQKGLVCILG